MFSFSGTSIKIKLATAAVVAAGALAMPAVSSAAATGCAAGGTGSAGPECEFVGGVGASHTGTVAGGATQFQINPSGAVVTCTNSRANARTVGSNVVNVRLTFANCTGASYPAVVTCPTIDPASPGTLGPLSTPITIQNIYSPGVADGVLELGPLDCRIVVTTPLGSCTIDTARSGFTHNIFVTVANAVAGSHAVLTVGVTGNTDALSFQASGFACSLASIPATGTATFSNNPKGAPSNIVYTEVPTRLDIR